MAAATSTSSHAGAAAASATPQEHEAQGRAQGAGRDQPDLPLPLVAREVFSAVVRTSAVRRSGLEALDAELLRLAGAPQVRAPARRRGGGGAHSVSFLPCALLCLAGRGAAGVPFVVSGLLPPACPPSPWAPAIAPSLWPAMSPPPHHHPTFHPNAHARARDRPQLASGGMSWMVNERQAEALVRSHEALMRLAESIAAGEWLACLCASVCM